MNQRTMMIWIVLFFVFFIGVGYLGVWKFMVERTWVPAGYSLQLTRLTGSPAPPDSYAGDGEQGVQEKMLGPGRHFLMPWEYNTKLVRDFEIPPGHIALLRNNVGREIPKDDNGRFLAKPDEKGTQINVLTPGVWRLNEFGQTAYIQQEQVAAGLKNTQPMVYVPPGYVGVQMKAEGKDKGIQSRILQAGYYAINPEQIKVTVIGVGYDVLDLHVDYDKAQVKDKDGSMKTLLKPREGTGVSFPLADGKQMYLDVTVVWGIYPEDAPRIVGEYGTLDMLEQKIIVPQVLSICKNSGSDLTTQNFIAGATREKFQERFTEELQAMGKAKGIHFLIAVVRGFHPDIEIAETIQAKMIAEEEIITLSVEKDRDTVAASLEAAQRKVQTALRDFDAETLALVAGEKEEGLKSAAMVKAETDRKVASIDKNVAELTAKAVTIAGKADADVQEMKARAEAELLKLMVTAYGGADSYNLATFAKNLPEQLKIEYRYAGPGTFWTDSKENQEALAAKKILSTQEKPQSPGKK